MQPPPQRPEPPALRIGTSKPQWTDPSLPSSHATQPVTQFQFPAADMRSIERRRRRRRNQTVRIYATLIGVVVLMGALAVWQLIERQQRAAEPQPATQQPMVTQPATTQPAAAQPSGS